MSDEYDLSLVAWANTFNSGVSTPPAVSLSDFASGDALIPIVQTIVGHEDDDDEVDSDSTAGWAGVLGRMKAAGLIKEDAEVPRPEEEDKLGMVVTCLEALLRHTVGEHCLGRETFIRQIMSLDAATQTMLSHIIVGQQQHQSHDGCISETGSPSRESLDSDDSGSSVVGSPSPSSRSLEGSPLEHFCHTDAGSSSDDCSNFNGRNFKSWFSPGKDEGARELRAAGAAGVERAAPVGPKKRQGPNRDTETEAASVRAGTALLPKVVDVSGLTSTAVEITDLQAEVASLRSELAESERAHGQSTSVIEGQYQAAVARETELSEELRRARQAAERVACSGEDEVIAVENAIRAKHEREVEVLHDRANKAEERVLLLEPLEEEVERLRDEVDVLRPAERKLSKVEENLSRCRARIEELSDLPGQLKREEDAHAEVLDRCLVLETEVAQIPALRRQLESYRRSSTDMEMANREQTRKLKLAQEEVSRLSQEMQALADGSGEVRNEHQKLQEELHRRTMEEAEREEGGGGIGLGVSELNPVLSEELARLRRQNEELAAKVDYNTVETIQDLEQKADDANRLADSFHESLASERELRAAAETSLAAARARIAELEAEIAALREDHRESIARLEAEAVAAAAAAATALESSRQMSRDALEAAETSAAAALQAERIAGAERLSAAEREGEAVAESLRGEMAAAAEAAKAARSAAEQERRRERDDLEGNILATVEAAEKEKERARAEAVATDEKYARQMKEMEELVESEREQAARKAEEAAEGLAAAKRAFEGEVSDVKRGFEARLEEGRVLAAGEVAAERERTAGEERARLEESRRKEEAMQQVKRLEEELSAGKKAALTAIERLKTNARELREESGWMRQQAKEDHDARMAALNAEFDRYREAHTVDDASYLKDMHEWDKSTATHKKRIADLQVQLDALKKDKRRLEREKTYYWGQAEELRMSAMAGGRADPTRDAEHAQLVEQARELIEENRELKQRVQDYDGTGGGVGGDGAGARGAGRWGSSGVAAMRAEHESEVVALKEEKQDMLLKYHATSSKLNEQERRCGELSEEMEEMRNKLVELQEKKLSENSTTVAASTERKTSSQKENQARISMSSAKSRSGESKPHSRASRKGGLSERQVASTSVAVRSAGVGGTAGTAASAHGRVLRGLGNTTSQEDRAAVSKGMQATRHAGGVDGDDGETPSECVQS